MTEDWTSEELKTLIQAMRASIPEQSRMTTYLKGQREMDWNKVAFHPHSSQACQQKWKQILQKMRRVRTLMELLDEAEEALDKPFRKSKIHPELPKRPNPPNAIFNEENWANLQMRHPDLSQAQLLKLCNKKYKALPDQEKAKYVKQFHLSAKEYKTRLIDFRVKFQNVKKRKDTLIHEDGQYNEDGRMNEDSPESSPPPKPPINGYVLFCKELASAGRGSTTQESSWKRLTESQKKEYRTRCEQLKKEYTEKLDVYLRDFDEEAQQWIIEKYGIKRSEKDRIKALKNKFPGEPKLPPRSGRTEFRKEQMLLQKEKTPNPRKRLFLSGKYLANREETRLTNSRTSDSEDIEMSSSDEDDGFYISDEEEEDEDNGMMFCIL